MTRMSTSVQHLAMVERELLAHHDEIRSAVSGVEPPKEPYPYHRLVEEAVGELLRDARLGAAGCRRFSEAIGDFVRDLSVVDQEVAASTARGQVR